MENILITSAGQRVTLVEIFKKAVLKCGIQAKVFTTDMNPKYAPAGYVSDECFQVPKCTEDIYVDTLIDICKRNDVKIIVPTIDTELLILSHQKDFFAANGISVIVSEESFVSCCRDKRKTNGLMDRLGIKVPKAIDKNNPKFPMFAKPYDGSLSTNIHFIKTPGDLTPEILHDEKLMFMEYIDKNVYKEFTVDMYFGRDNVLKAVIPRERIKVRAGEINKGITRRNSIVEFLKQKMSYLQGVFGCICVQLFFCETDNDIIAIEINPRFGGGYPLSYYAGADFAEMLIKEYLLGEKIEYFDNWKDNTLMLRYDKDIIIYEE